MKVEVITRDSLQNPNRPSRGGLSVGGYHTWVRVDGGKWYQSERKMGAHKANMLFEQSSDDPSKCLLLWDADLRANTYPETLSALFFLCPERGIVPALDDPDHPVVAPIIQACKEQE